MFTVLQFITQIYFLYFLTSVPTSYFLLIHILLHCPSYPDHIFSYSVPTQYLIFLLIFSNSARHLPVHFSQQCTSSSCSFFSTVSVIFLYIFSNSARHLPVHFFQPCASSSCSFFPTVCVIFLFIFSNSVRHLPGFISNSVRHLSAHNFWFLINGFSW